MAATLTARDYKMPPYVLMMQDERSEEVTTNRGGLKHLGDITKINGADIEPVDCIIGGAPCQDLSAAGKRAGMKHPALGDEETTRSGLFIEQIRIVQAFRE